MSVCTLEAALYPVANTREGRKSFLADRDAFLNAFPLSPEERAMILDFDVAELVRRGVNPMLVFGFWMQAEGSRSAVAYHRRLNQ